MLAKLRDIHEPLPPSSWPWAIGWWLLLGMLLLALLGAGWWWWRRHYSVAKRLQRRLMSLGNGDTFLAELNQLLKEAACYYHGASASRLAGRAWTTFLQQHGPRNIQRTLLEHLESGPYAASYPIHYEQFRQLKAYARQWIDRQGGEGV